MNSKICQFYKGYRMSLGKLRHVFAPRMRGILGARFESSIKFDASQDDVAEIIDRTLVRWQSRFQISVICRRCSL